MPEQTKSKLVPRLRFPEFRKAAKWDVLPMGSLINLEYGSALPEHSRRLGSIPVVGSNGVVGCHDEALVKGPAIVVGRKGSVGEVNWIDTDCYPIDTAYYVVNKKPSSTSMRFLYRLLQVSKLDDRQDPSAVPGLNRNAVHSLDAAIPELREQEKIADCLTSLDEIIAAQGQKVETLKAYKRGLVQRLFPREDAASPLLRFSEFTNSSSWRPQKISGLLSKVSNAVNVEPESMYYEIGIRSHGKGLFHKKPILGKAIGAKRVFHVVPGALILSIVFAWEQAVAVTSPREIGTIASHRFPMYVAKPGKCDIQFMKEFFLTTRGKQLLGVASPGGAGRNKTLGQKDFENLEIVLPTSVYEQARIASSLSSLESNIKVESEKLVLLKSQKKGLLRQLFPVAEEA